MGIDLLTAEDAENAEAEEEKNWVRRCTQTDADKKTREIIALSMVFLICVNPRTISFSFLRDPRGKKIYVFRGSFSFCPGEVRAVSSVVAVLFSFARAKPALGLPCFRGKLFLSCVLSVSSRENASNLILPSCRPAFRAIGLRGGPSAASFGGRIGRNSR